jgi:hypothetical protein
LNPQIVKMKMDINVFMTQIFSKISLTQ